jgi:hypothetical protein
MTDDTTETARDARRRLEDIAFAELGPTLSDVPPALINVVRAACVDILKMDGRFRDKAEVTGADGGPPKLEDVSARELIERRIAGLAARSKAAEPTE